LIYKYSGYDKNGKRVKDRISAADIDEAKRKLKNQGIIYESLKESSDRSFSGFSLKRAKKLPPKKLAQLSKNLAIYLKSGIPIVNVIKLAKSQYEDDSLMVDFLTSLESSMNEGNSFYVSLENQKVLNLPSFYKQSIKVAEESGALSEVMFEMARFIEEQDKVSGQVKQALVYPSVIIVISIFMVAFMLTTVVPKITKMFDQLKQELPTVTKIVIAMGDFLGEYWLQIMITLLVIVALFSFMMKRSDGFRYRVHSFLLSLPLFGKIIRTFELARFSYITSVLSKSGVTFVHAVKLSSGILDNMVMKREFESASRDVVEGKKFSTSLAKYGKHIDNSFIQAIALGEETSEVAMVMENMADLYFSENRDKINMFLSLMEPMLILFVGATIGFIVIAMLLPIFSMNMANF
jgi:general secretion pathway protein F/type IV pilus assembly protein PilC